MAYQQPIHAYSTATPATSYTASPPPASVHPFRRQSEHLVDYRPPTSNDRLYSTQQSSPPPPPSPWQHQQIPPHQEHASQPTRPLMPPSPPEFQPDACPSITWIPHLESSSQSPAYGQAPAVETLPASLDRRATWTPGTHPSLPAANLTQDSIQEEGSTNASPPDAKSHQTNLQELASSPPLPSSNQYQSYHPRATSVSSTSYDHQSYYHRSTNPLSTVFPSIQHQSCQPTPTNSPLPTPIQNQLIQTPQQTPANPPQQIPKLTDGYQHYQGPPSLPPLTPGSNQYRSDRHASISPVHPTPYQNNPNIPQITSPAPLNSLPPQYQSSQQHHHSQNWDAPSLVPIQYHTAPAPAHYYQLHPHPVPHAPPVPYANSSYSHPSQPPPSWHAQRCHTYPGPGMYQHSHPSGPPRLGIHHLPPPPGAAVKSSSTSASSIKSKVSKFMKSGAGKAAMAVSGGVALGSLLGADLDLDLGLGLDSLSLEDSFGGGEGGGSGWFGGGGGGGQENYGDMQLMGTDYLNNSTMNGMSGLSA